MPELSIIIVNWNSANYLDTCIRTIRENTRGLRYEIIVVDNASYDGSEAVARRHGDSVRFFQSDENLGFARANNLGFRHSVGKTLLFLNPDTEIRGDALVRMNDCLSRLSDAGCLGCRILNADGSVQTSCIQSFPTILNQFLDSEFMRCLWPNSGLWGNASLFLDPKEAVEVEAISGACLMMNRGIFEQIGLFSEDYFMYTEDVDLCYKVRQAGYKNYYIPKATIIHFGGGSSGKKGSNFSAIVMRESRVKFFRKTKGYLYSLMYRISTLIAALVRIAVLATLFPVFMIRKRNDSWKYSFQKWRSILEWSIGFGKYVKTLY